MTPKKYLLLAAWLLANLPIAPIPACTTLLVGKDATIDGSMIFARNNDEHDALSVNSLYRHAKSRGPYQFQGNAGSFSFTSNRGSLAYTALPNAKYVGTARISYEEAGINEHGLTISATETIYNSSHALAVDPYVDSGITEDGITSVILAQAKTARDAVRLLGRIVERQGAGEGFGVAFGDRQGIWYFETASGHHWLARKLPNHAYFVSANQGRFQEVNLKDTRTTLASPGLRRFAVRHHLWEPRTEPFNFLRSFVSDTPHDATYNYPRVERLISRYSGIDVAAQAPYFPVFLKPNRKLSVWDVASGLRDHYQGTSNDPYQTRNPAAPYRPMAVLRTAHSHIMQKRPDFPKDLGTVLYLALGMEDLAPYLPIYNGLPTIPRALQIQTSLNDEEALYWNVRKMQALVFQNYPKYAPWAHQVIQDFEQEIQQRQIALESAYRAQYRKHLTVARTHIQAFTDTLIAEAKRRLDGVSARIIADLGMPAPTHDDIIQMLIEAEKKHHYGGA